MELNLKTIKNKAEDAIFISHASIVFPFCLGVMLAYFLYEEFTHGGVSFIAFALFMGIAMSITAFPVLARIIHERGLNKQPIGAIAITCAAVDDVTAWCLLAAVIAIAKAGSFLSSLYVILLAVVYIVLMFQVVRPVLQRIVDFQQSRSNISKSAAAIFFIMLFVSACITELIGIHALFGAFLAGVMMPADSRFRNLLTEKIEYVTLIVLLPLFFVYTGLRTEIGLLNNAHLWLVCGLITAVAVVGKFLGSALAARFVGINMKDSLTIGALMNTRGLMELVVLNIGLDLGILSPQVFAMMVIMALVTTFMTSPSLSIIDRLFKKRGNEEYLSQESEKKYKILIPFASSYSGKKLLNIASFISKKEPATTEMTMLHVSEGNILHQYNVQEEEQSLFKPIEDEAKALDRQISMVFDVSNHSEKTISRIANKSDYDFVLIGSRGNFQLDKGLLSCFLGFSRRISRFANKRRFPVSPFEDRTRYLLSKVDAQVGIFIDKGVEDIENIFVPILDDDDIYMGDFLLKIAEGNHITLWDDIQLTGKSLEFVTSVNELKDNHSFLLWDMPVDENVLGRNDLIVISLRSWRALRRKDAALIERMPSTLILTTP